MVQHSLNTWLKKHLVDDNSSVLLKMQINRIIKLLSLLITSLIAFLKILEFGKCDNMFIVENYSCATKHLFTNFKTSDNVVSRGKIKMGNVGSIV